MVMHGVAAEMDRLQVPGRIAERIGRHGTFGR
jgi:hypothetical protein